MLHTQVWNENIFSIISISFKEFWLYKLETYKVYIKRNSVKNVQKVIYLNRMHDVYLSQQSRLTLLNMLTKLIKKFYIGFYLLLLLQDVHSRNSTNENLWFFPKSYFFFQTVQYWRPLLITMVCYCIKDGRFKKISHGFKGRILHYMYVNDGSDSFLEWSCTVIQCMVSYKIDLLGNECEPIYIDGWFIFLTTIIYLFPGEITVIPINKENLYFCLKNKRNVWVEIVLKFLFSIHIDLCHQV